MATSDSSGGSDQRPGVVYLLHFDRPYQGRMQHYVGWTVDLDRRIREHREGHPNSRTTRRAWEQGIGFIVVRTWPGRVAVERHIKRSGPPSYCPICQASRVR